MSDKRHSPYFGMVLSAMFLALALVLPLLTGQLQQTGNALCPMHIPVLLCAFFCGPLHAAAVGALAPVLRFLLFGAPPLIPIGLAMCFELCTYGLVCGIVYRKLAGKNSADKNAAGQNTAGQNAVEKNSAVKKGAVYISLITAMLSGRLVWGLVRAAMYGVSRYDFGWKAFVTGAFVNAVPGIIIQLIVIPVIVSALKKETAAG